MTHFSRSLTSVIDRNWAEFSIEASFKSAKSGNTLLHFVVTLGGIFFHAITGILFKNAWYDFLNYFFYNNYILDGCFMLHILLQCIR